MKKNKIEPMLFWILGLIGFIFLRSGYGKVTGGEFVGGLGKTLGFFASENPYPFMKTFLLGTAMSNTGLFGTLTMFGEVLIGVSILVPVLYFVFKSAVTTNLMYLLGAGLVGALLMNLTFWLAAGWTSPSTDSLNMLMLAIDITGIAYVVRVLKKSM